MQDTHTALLNTFVAIGNSLVRHFIMTTGQVPPVAGTIDAAAVIEFLEVALVRLFETLPSALPAELANIAIMVGSLF